MQFNISLHTVPMEITEYRKARKCAKIFYHGLTILWCLYCYFPSNSSGLIEMSVMELMIKENYNLI